MRSNYDTTYSLTSNVLLSAHIRRANQRRVRDHVSAESVPTPEGSDVTANSHDRPSPPVVGDHGILDAAPRGWECARRDRTGAASARHIRPIEPASCALNLSTSRCSAALLVRSAW